MSFCKASTNKIHWLGPGWFWFSFLKTHAMTEALLLDFLQNLWRFIPSSQVLSPRKGKEPSRGGRRFGRGEGRKWVPSPSEWRLGIQAPHKALSSEVVGFCFWKSFQKCHPLGRLGTSRLFWRAMERCDCGIRCLSPEFPTKSHHHRFGWQYMQLGGPHGACPHVRGGWGKQKEAGELYPLQQVLLGASECSRWDCVNPIDTP